MKTPNLPKRTVARFQIVAGWNHRARMHTTLTLSTSDLQLSPSDLQLHLHTIDIQRISHGPSFSVTCFGRPKVRLATEAQPSVLRPEASQSGEKLTTAAILTRSQRSHKS